MIANSPRHSDINTASSEMRLDPLEAKPYVVHGHFDEQRKQIPGTCNCDICAPHLTGDTE